MKHLALVIVVIGVAVLVLAIRGTPRPPGTTATAERAHAPATADPDRSDERFAPRRDARLRPRRVPAVTAIERSNRGERLAEIVRDDPVEPWFAERRGQSLRDLLVARFADAELAVEVDAIECHSSSCRLVVTSDRDELEQVQRELQIPPYASVFELGEMTARDDGTIRSEAYVLFEPLLLEEAAFQRFIESQHAFFRDVP